jgi:hypoxanthine phosphoribosyltransferase
VKILLTEDEIREGVARLGRELNDFYRGRPITVIGVLTGSVMLLADLIRRLEMPLNVGVIQARSYRGAATSPGALSLSLEYLPEIRDRDVLVVDDIFDTGQTLEAVVGQLEKLGARSVRSAVLLRKEGRRRVSIEPDHVVFEIPDRFVVGYGLDYQDAYRNLPYVAALEGEEVGGGGLRVESRG